MLARRILFVALIAAAPSAPATALDAAQREAAARIDAAARASDFAYDLLGRLCDEHGHRLSGSERLERAIDWMAERLSAAGLENVRKQPVEVPTWVRGEESLELLSPQSLRLAVLGLGMSVGTPKDGITAEVLSVSSFDELASLADSAVAGRIVLFDVPYEGYGRTVAYRSRGAIEAARRGAVAALVRSIGPTGHRTPHTGALRYDDAVTAVPAAAVGAEDAQLLTRLQSRGTPAVVRLRMQARTEADRLSHNLIGEVVGRELPHEVVVVGGHIDSWDVGQGAQDDGVGCVLAVEAARLLLELDLRPRRTVRVVLFTNEENGLRGGRAYQQLHANEVDRHVAALESDSGNGLASGFRFDLRAPAGSGLDEAALTAARDRALRELREVAAALLPAGSDSLFAAGAGADISPLAEVGVPCFGLHHDTSEYFRIHHTEADTFDRIDLGDLRANAAVLAVWTWALAELDLGMRP